MRDGDRAGLNGEAVPGVDAAQAYRPDYASSDRRGGLASIAKGVDREANSGEIGFDSMES